MIRFHRRTRFNHWSSSKLAKILRKQAGLESPYALSAEGWATHEKRSKEIAPFVDWFTDELFDKVQDFVMFVPDCFYSVKVFLRNWKDKSHVLDGGFEVGQWVDRCTRFNTCLFYELEKFIEKEKGLETLEWEKGLVYDESWGYEKDHEDFGKPTHQALAAIEQEAIYKWWKANKNRDFFEESGLGALYEQDKCETGSIWENFSKPETKEKKACRELQNELESKFKEEEEEMLIRLIKIRDSLWT